MSKLLFLAIFLSAALFAPKTMEASENIESVYISEICQMKYPCVHQVRITYDDDTEETFSLDGFAIQSLIESVNDSTKFYGASLDHFSGYIQQALTH